MTYLLTLWRRIGFAAALVWAASASQAAGPQPQTGRVVLPIEQGWLFHQGDIVPPATRGQNLTYAMTKAGSAWGPAGTEYDDSSWRKVKLPHDWAVEGPFVADENIAQGYRPRGIGWYRRYLKLDEAQRGRHFELQFDGIATHATVWVNGNLVRRSWSGYAASNIDITPFLTYGQDVNAIAVRVDAQALEGWWYEGAGIYRHAWLVERAPLHVVTDGVHANPRQDAQGRWHIPVEVRLNNSGTHTESANVRVTVFAPQGHTVAVAEHQASVAALGQDAVKLSLKVPNPELWSVQQPRLYRVLTQVLQQGQTIDDVELRTGLRTIRFDADRGFFLNDRPVKLQGVAIHHDHAGVGVAVPDAIWAYRLRRLKDMGVNAVRFAHNATAPEVLALCDELGLLVMAENRQFNPAPENMAQLTWLVRRDRNHPSVILWSVFNEEPMQATPEGVEMVRRMVAEVKQLDTTRPVTAAMNDGFFASHNVSQVVDVVGFNYHPYDYDRYHQSHPTKPMFSSEDTSAFQSRGEFATDRKRGLASSYDDYAADWGRTHRQAWADISSRPFVAGGFAWTGFDYRGEPTPFEWPATGSVFGAMDLCGFPKTAYYLRQAQWLHDRPVLQIQPHWNWPGKEGQNVRVMLISNLPTVSLSLNGRTLGRQPVGADHVAWFDVAYAPGKLEAVGLRDDREVARHEVQTTGEPVALELLPDRSALAADGRDAMPITVRALDAQGRAVPTAAVAVDFSIEGPGLLLGTGNGDGTSHEPEQLPHRSLYNGLAQLIVQSSRSAVPGTLTVRATAPGLRAAVTQVSVQPGQAPAEVSTPTPINIVRNWRISPPFAQRPDPQLPIADNDNNSWGWGQTPVLMPVAEGRWRIYRTEFTPRADMVKGRLTFADITGRAEVFLDGQPMATKTTLQAGPLSFALDGKPGRRTVTVLVDAERGDTAGLGDRATLGSP